MCVLEAERRIRTERLVLRAPCIEDAERIAALINDYDIARMMPPIPHPYTRDDARDFLAESKRDPASNRPLAIELPGEGLIGMTGFHKRGLFFETGYWIGRPFRGQGYATEACRGGVDWAFRTLGLRAVISGHLPENAASARVLQKCGFLYTGEVRRRFSRSLGEEVDVRMMVRLA